MATTRMSSKGQVIIPRAVRKAHHWEAGLELIVIDTGDGVLLRPKSPFSATDVGEVAGLLRAKVEPKTDEQISAAIKRGVRRQWRGRA